MQERWSAATILAAKCSLASRRRRDYNEIEQFDRSNQQFDRKTTGRAMSNLDKEGKIFIGKSAEPEYLTIAFGNRHGLVTGATGTGKTVTLQTMAEGFARAGVPVFAADIKGDLSGIAMPGERRDAFVKRAKEIGFEYETDEFPVVFWDLFGEQGHPV